jgi:hypothetical protein
MKRATIEIKPEEVADVLSFLDLDEFASVKLIRSIGRLMYRVSAPEDVIDSYIKYKNQKE